MYKSGFRSFLHSGKNDRFRVSHLIRNCISPLGQQVSGRCIKPPRHWQRLRFGPGELFDKHLDVQRDFTPAAAAPPNAVPPEKELRHDHNKRWGGKGGQALSFPSTDQGLYYPIPKKGIFPRSERSSKSPLWMKTPPKKKNRVLSRPFNLLLLSRDSADQNYKLSHRQNRGAMFPRYDDRRGHHYMPFREQTPQLSDPSCR